MKLTIQGAQLERAEDISMETGHRVRGALLIPQSSVITAAFRESFVSLVLELTIRHPQHSQHSQKTWGTEEKRSRGKYG